MEKDATQIRTDALQFLKNHPAGVLATVSKDYSPHAAAVFYVADDSFNIYFLTKRDSRKYAAISAHPQVAFAVGRLDVPQTLQIEGVASEIQDDSEKAQHVPALIKTLTDNNPH
jgi:nitroimidazol reductase NimA-like FMN-containing flavoprotein (pyridoxamine 5'-phosphate oxidase superfamily)